MIRLCFAALAVTCGLSQLASAQVYTTYYGAGPAYSANGTAYGPLRVFDARWWAGAPPYGTNYTSYYGAAAPYTSYYGATPAYTAGYTPSYGVYRSSFYRAAMYAPSYGAYYGSTLASANGCCVVPTTACCSPCSSCGLACAGGDCVGGNCGMNYGPVDMAPTPDAGMSGSSGSRRFESESGSRAPEDPIDPLEEDGFRRSDPGADYEGGTPRGAGYGPQRSIEQKNGDDLPKKPTEAPESTIPDDGFNPVPSEPEAPAADRSLLDLDSRVTSAPSLQRQRHTMQARFGSPKVARAEVDPATLPVPVELRIVKK